MQYYKTGHGGNVCVKTRDPSDYHVAVLEVAGTAADHGDILSMEGRWQRKLRSRGVRRNEPRRLRTGFFGAGSMRRVIHG
jgi:hypothetical protein